MGESTFHSWIGRGISMKMGFFWQFVTKQELTILLQS